MKIHIEHLDGLYYADEDLGNATINVSNLPSGLTFNNIDNTIDGTISNYTTKTSGQININYSYEYADKSITSTYFINFTINVENYYISLNAEKNTDENITADYLIEVSGLVGINYINLYPDNCPIFLTEFIPEIKNENNQTFPTEFENTDEYDNFYTETTFNHEIIRSLPEEKANFNVASLTSDFPGERAREYLIGYAKTPIEDEKIYIEFSLSERNSIQRNRNNSRVSNYSMY